VRWVRYEVQGETRREVQESLRRHGREMEGSIAYGWTEWAVDVGYTVRRTDERCRLTGPEVELRVTVHLPEWVPPAGADGADVVGFNQYVRRIRHHEEGHVDIARRAARDVYAALAEMPPGGCDALRSRASAVSDSVLADARGRQDRYDRETDHGRAQGAAWPSG
jgi:predicted secreted Zn-dependent protease